MPKSITKSSELILSLVKIEIKKFSNIPLRLICINFQKFCSVCINKKFKAESLGI